MGIWDSAVDFFSGGGRSDINDAYEKAQSYLRPYKNGGAQDYQDYRNYSNQFSQNLQPWQNAGGWQYNQINQSPQAYYDSIMKGYSESPQAKQEQEQAMRAATAGGSASGMIGSGAFQKALQGNAADITARDQQRYFGNVAGANQMQMGYLGDLRGQQDKGEAMRRYLTSLGYNASTGMGNNAINQGMANASLDRQTIEDILSMIGFGGGGGLAH